MARAAIRANQYIQLTLLGLDDAKGSQAAYTELVISGTSTRSGQLQLSVSGEMIKHAGSALSNGELAAIYGAVIAGESDPARPLHTLTLPGLDITAQENWPGRTEQESVPRHGRRDRTVRDEGFCVFLI